MFVGNNGDNLRDMIYMLLRVREISYGGCATETTEMLRCAGGFEVCFRSYYSD
jgi:hypothetical protein